MAIAGYSAATGAHWRCQAGPHDAFVALGPVRYVTHTGERPMGVTWKLETLIPAALFEKFAALLAA